MPHVFGAPVTHGEGSGFTAFQRMSVPAYLLLGEAGAMFCIGVHGPYGDGAEWPARIVFWADFRPCFPPAVAN